MVVMINAVDWAERHPHFAAPYVMTKELAAKSQKRVRNPAQTREKLLRAAVDLIAESGVAAVSLRQAARRAKVSRASAYIYFDDRNQLLNEATLWITDELQAAVKHSDKYVHLYDRVLSTVKLVLKHPEAAKLMIVAAMNGTNLDQEHPLYKLVHHRLRDLKKDGKLRADVDLETMAYINFGSLASCIMLAAQSKGDELDEIAVRFANEWTRSLEQGIFVRVSRRGTGDRNLGRNARVLRKSAAVGK